MVWSVRRSTKNMYWVYIKLIFKFKSFRSSTDYFWIKREKATKMHLPIFLGNVILLIGMMIKYMIKSLQAHFIWYY